MREEEDDEALPYRIARTPSELESIRRHLNSGTRQVHVTALDEVVSVNSFFTVAVFIGISLTSGSNLHLGSPPAQPECAAGVSAFRRLILYEVLAFGCFQFSSLVAHGLKLLMVFKNTNNGLQQQGTVSINHKLLRVGILASALGSAAGTTLLMLSLVDYAQLRFGSLSCADRWVLQSTVPLIALVSTGIAIFLSAVVYAFLH